MTVATFEWYRPRWAYLAPLVLITVTWVVLVIGWLSGGLFTPKWLLICWTVGIPWNWYWFGFRVAFRAELTERELCWYAPLRRGTIALGELTEIRSARFSYAFAVYAQRSGPKVLMLTRKGISDFNRELYRRAPQARYSEIRWAGLLR